MATEASPARSALSTADLTMSSRRHRDAAVLLRQLQCRVDQLESKKALTDSKQQMQRRVHERRQEVLQERRVAQSLIEMQRAREIQNKIMLRKEELERKEHSRVEMFGLFHERRAVVQQRSVDWKEATMDSVKESESYQAFKIRNAQEQRTEHAQRRCRVISEVEKARQEAHQQRLNEVAANKRLIEARESQRMGASAALVRSTHMLERCGAAAKAQVEQRNHDTRCQIVEDLNRLHNLSVNELMKDLGKLQERERQLTGAF